MILRTDNTPTLFDNLADCLTQNYYKYYGNCYYHKNYNVGGNMNYQKMYDNLVQNAKKRSKEIEQIVKNKKIRYNHPISQARYIKTWLIDNTDYKAIDVHHIIPKCDGGNDMLDNFVFFTPKEHVIAHHLLYKAQPTNKHFLAWHYLINTDRRNLNYKKQLTPKQYEELTIKNREIIHNRIVKQETREKLRKRSTGKNNGMYNKHWYTNGKINIVCNENEIPDGFYKGRLDVVPKNKKYSTIGYKWYNNGIINKMFKDNEIIPEEFIAGMLDKRKGFILYNNGKITKRFHQTDVIPEGFVKGRLKKEANNEN